MSQCLDKEKRIMEMPPSTPRPVRRSKSAPAFLGRTVNNKLFKEALNILDSMKRQDSQTSS